MLIGVIILVLICVVLMCGFLSIPKATINHGLAGGIATGFITMLCFYILFYIGVKTNIIELVPFPEQIGRSVVNELQGAGYVFDAAESQSPIIYCTDCGRELESGDKFCGGCGKAVIKDN